VDAAPDTNPSLIRLRFTLCHDGTSMGGRKERRHVRFLLTAGPPIQGGKGYTATLSVPFRLFKLHYLYGFDGQVEIVEGSKP